MLFKNYVLKKNFSGSLAVFFNLLLHYLVDVIESSNDIFTFSPPMNF